MKVTILLQIGPFAEEAMESIQAQSFKSWTCWLLGKASFYTEPFMEFAEASLEELLERTETDYIHIMQSTTILGEEFLARCLDAFKENPAAKAIMSGIFYDVQIGSLMYRASNWVAPSAVFGTFRDEIPIDAVVFRRSCLKRIEKPWTIDNLVEKLAKEFTVHGLPSGTFLVTRRLINTGLTFSNLQDISKILPVSEYQ